MEKQYLCTVKSSATLDNGQVFQRLETSNNSNVINYITPLHRQNTDAVTPDYGKWYLMRAAYGQEKKVVEYLSQREDIAEVFCPEWYQERTFNGKKKKVLVSVMPNTLFVKSTEEVLHQYIGVPPLTFFHHYYQRHHDEHGRDIGTGRKPIIIPDDQISSFRKWLDADVEDKIYMNDAFTFKKDDIVMVTEGCFAGFTGHIVRLKGQTRVGVNIEGVGFISTTYIPKHCLKLVHENNYIESSSIHVR